MQYVPHRQPYGQHQNQGCQTVSQSPPSIDQKSGTPFSGRQLSLVQNSGHQPQHPVIVRWRDSRGNLVEKRPRSNHRCYCGQKSGLKIGDDFVSSHGFDEDPDLAHDHAKFKVSGILKGTGTVLDQLILTNTASIWEMHAHAATEGEAEHDHEHMAADTLNEHVHDNSNNDLLAHPEEQITSILIEYKSASNYQALNMPRAINENTAMQAASPAYEINKLYDMIGTGTETIRYIALLIAIVSLISIFISLYQSMKQRKYELAILRVMGSSRSGLFY